jgi:NAD(P)H-dependent FMN reductase
MSDNRLKLAVIIGSVRQGRFGPTVANWFASEAERREDVEIDLIDLADVALGSEAPSMEASAEVLQALSGLTPRLDAADAFVVVTPEYNHSFPAALKNAIDWHNTQFRAKPVAFVCYGGFSGGLRAVDHLRVVFSELHAVTTRDTVSFHGTWATFDAGGRPKDPDGPAAAAKTLLDQVMWWARVLRDAKATTPYGA